MCRSAPDLRRFLFLTSTRRRCISHRTTTIYALSPDDNNNNDIEAVPLLLSAPPPKECDTEARRGVVTFRRRVRVKRMYIHHPQLPAL